MPPGDRHQARIGRRPLPAQRARSLGQQGASEGRPELCQDLLRGIHFGQAHDNTVATGADQREAVRRQQLFQLRRVACDKVGRCPGSAAALERIDIARRRCQGPIGRRLDRPTRLGRFRRKEVAHSFARLLRLRHADEHAVTLGQEVSDPGLRQNFLDGLHIALDRKRAGRVERCDRGDREGGCWCLSAWRRSATGVREWDRLSAVECLACPCFRGLVEGFEFGDPPHQSRQFRVIPSWKNK